jgi:hypothetical protein
MAIDHDSAARTKSFAGMPDVRTTNGVEDDIDALSGESANLRHEVLMLVINGDSTQVGYGRRLPRRESTHAGPVRPWRNGAASGTP